VYVLGIGADAVTNAILSIGNARLFLENDRLDIKVGRMHAHWLAWGVGVRACMRSSVHWRLSLCKALARASMRVCVRACVHVHGDPLMRHIPRADVPSLPKCSLQ